MIRIQYRIVQGLLLALIVSFALPSQDAFAAGRTRAKKSEVKRTSRGSVRHAEKSKNNRDDRRNDRKDDIRDDRRDDRRDDIRDDRRDDRRDDIRDRRREDRWDDIRDRRPIRALVRLGAALVGLPRGHVTVLVGGATYYYHDGLYYRNGPSGYVVVMGPMAARVRVLPVGYSVIYVGPETYYYYYGTFYRFDERTTEFIVVAAPPGAIVPMLPNGYVETIDAGRTIFVVGRSRYRPIYRGGVLVYRVF